ncbi:MAG: hypothetical protein H6Q22_1002 [Bacteroidetes bacterium]|nr:hypothetical protein [Bacteroidota bacterium]
MSKKSTVSLFCGTKAKVAGLAFLLLFVSIGACAQSLVESSLINSGFENVRHITAGGKEIVFLESRAFTTNERLLNAAMKSVEEVSDQFTAKNVEIILMEERIPKFRMFASLETPGAAGRLNWKSDFSVKDSYDKLNLESNLENKDTKFYNSSFGKIDILFYPIFRFKNSVLNRMYLVQFNINPAIEMSLWRGASITAQVIFPLVNDYSTEEGKIRPGYLTFSQQFRLPYNIFAKATVGNFSMFRAGGDLKLFRPIGKRIGIYGQLSYTAYSVPLFNDWYYNDFDKFTWKIGANYFVKPWNLMFNFNVAKYLGNDVSFRGEITRHFKNASVGFYVQTMAIEEFPVNGGFFFAIALPPYKQFRNKFVRVSTGNYFPFEYIARPYTDYGRYFTTSPDENSSDNFFTKMRLNQIILNSTNN